MSDEGYGDGRTIGAKCGCLGATVVGAGLFLFLLMGDALGDCTPGARCSHGFLTHVLAPSAIVAALAFFVVRAVVNRIDRQ